MSKLIGSRPEQVSTNAMLGTAAFADMESLIFFAETSATPKKVGELVFQLTSNTSLTLKVKGSDGVVRSASLTLA